MRVPLNDLAAQHAEIAEDVTTGWAAVLDTCDFVGGADVAEFESEFAAFCGTEHCVGVANGTDALELILRAQGIGRGDEVILPANTFVASALAVARAGATPVLVDMDASTHLVDTDQIVAALTPRTRAIMPVHLYGQMAPMRPVREVAAEHDLAIVEDAAQAQGATQENQGIGALSDAAGTSFYPGKNLGAYGDAGAIVTNSPDIAAKVRALGNYGSDIKYKHPETGFNSRLDTLQAVVLHRKLGRLADWNAARARAARYYTDLLADLEDVVTPVQVPGNTHVWHLYVVRVPQRDRVLSELNAAGIGAAIHYPTPIHLLGALAHLGLDVGSFPVAEQVASEIISLPLFPHITREQQDLVVRKLREALP